MVYTSVFFLYLGCGDEDPPAAADDSDTTEETDPVEDLGGSVFYTSLGDLSAGPQVVWVVSRPGWIAAGDAVQVETSSGQQVAGVVWEDAFVAELTVSLGDTAALWVNGEAAGELAFDEAPLRDGLPETVGTEQQLTHPDAEPVPDAEGFYTYPIDMADIGWPVPALVFNIHAGRVVWVPDDGPDYTLAGRDRELFCIGSVRGDAAALTAAMCSRVVIAPL